MNPQQARARVADTFPQAFNRARFLEFTRNLLHRFDEAKATQWNTTYVKDAFKPHVARFERLGTYTSPDGEKLDVLIVHLTHAAQLERARTAIRNFVADYLKTRGEKDAALVAFVSPTERQWRFSYVKMEYAAVATESGKVGVETRLTPARRFSYIVGEGESCHTAQSRFLALLQDTENPPTLAQIEEAFSVEAVTKAFFNQYAALFGDLEAALQQLAAKDKAIGDEFTKKHVSTVDFAKKLMGQIVFLYFLQKKGWLGVEPGQNWGTGPHDFLRRLAGGEYGLYDNFFNDILEPLFYDTLATDRGHEAWCQNFKCRIPFLNGGLFEPLGDYDWRQTDITLPNPCFTNTERDPKTGDTGTGILDVFDRYNFTVNEAEPLEKEVAIDPEMLGKVFENLIEENRRKGLGSFYTPREIVHYMCQESLINYLDTSVNTPEPTVPRADLETFVHLGDQISHYEAVDARYLGREMPRKIKEHARRIDEKLADITVCDPAVGSGAFPVGMMTEIVRARSALTPYFNDVHDRTPYHFKRHAIQNCLYGVDIDPGAVEIAKLRLWLSLVVDEEDVKQIKPLPNLFYKIVTGNSLLGVEKNLFNEQLFRRLEELKPRYFDEPDKDKKDRYKQQIEDTIHELTNGKEAFDFEIYFSEVFHRKGGFDVLIANPPYVSHDRISEDKNGLRNAFNVYDSFADIYCYFIERGINILKQCGVLTFITSNSYIKADYGSKLRQYLSNHSCIAQLLNIEQSQVFETAIVNVAVLIALKTRTKGSEITRVTNSSWNSESFDKFVRIQGFDLPTSGFNSRLWTLADASILALRTKIEAKGTTLKSLGAKIRLGIATGHNGAFLVDAIMKKSLVAMDKNNAEIIVPIIRGRDIARYGMIQPKMHLIAARNGINIKKEYPTIFRHFESFGQDFKTRGAQGQYWWNLRACNFYDDFDHERIVWIELSDKARFTKCPAGIWCLNTAYFMLPPRGFSPNYILGLLNSCLIDFYFRLIAQTSGMGVTRWINLYVEKFPISLASQEKQKTVERLVERILEAKAWDAEADVSELEREIDQLVYALYGLTPEEIQIVEAAAK